MDDNDISNGGVLRDHAAEQVVLTAALDNPHLIPAVLQLPVDVFYTPVHQSLHAIMKVLDADGEPIDSVSVSRRAIAEYGTGLGKQVERFAISAVGKATNAVISFHLDRLRLLARARAVEETAVRLHQFARESVNGDDYESLYHGIDTTVDQLHTIRANEPAGYTADDLPPSLEDILQYQDSYDWLIPGVLERTDRLIVTGFEGTGKSFLLAQTALCVAAGLNPFLGCVGGAPAQVLVIDCENSERQTARRYRRIRRMVEGRCREAGVPIPDWSQQVRFVLRPEGVALNNPKEISRIERQVRATNPDLVIAGPLYRMHSLDTRDEQAAKELTDRLDGLRIKYRFALIAEAHVAHGNGRDARQLKPIGSSLFLRWPEFGAGLRPSQGTEEEEHPSSVDIMWWRGGREERVWPKTLKHNYDKLPWLADEEYRRRLRSTGVDTEPRRSA